MFKFVGFWKRLLITVIDIIILYFYIVIVFFIDQNLLNIKPYSDLEFFFIFSMIVFLPTITLFMLWKFKGASIGKLIFKVRIVDAETYCLPTNKQLLFRLIGNFISIFSFFLSYIHMAIDSRKQTWHDKLAKTVVVNKSAIEYFKSEEKQISNKRDLKLIKFELLYIKD